MATAFVSSDICVNSAEASVSDCFWTNEISQGISVMPKQIIYVNPFITFHSAPSLFPFSYSKHDIPELSKNDVVVHALIEADLNPNENRNLPMLEVS